MNNIDIDKIGVTAPLDRIREARERIMDIEKRVNIVLLQINEKETRLKYDTNLNDKEKVEFKKDIGRIHVHLKALLADL